MHEYFNYKIEGKNEDISLFLEKISEGICKDTCEYSSPPRFLLENSNTLLKYWNESKKNFSKLPKTITSITLGDDEEQNYEGELDFQEMNDFMVLNARNLSVTGSYSNSSMNYNICFLMKNGVFKQIDSFEVESYIGSLDIDGDSETLISNPWFGEEFKDLFDEAVYDGIDMDDLVQRKEYIYEHEFYCHCGILEKAFRYGCEPLSNSITSLKSDNSQSW